MKFKESHKIKILVYSGGELIGDALYKLNFFYYLRFCFPKASITYFAGQVKSEYFYSLKSISNKLFDEMIEDINFGSKKNFLKDFFNKCPIDKEYDVLIDTQSDYRCSFVLKKIKAKIFISYSLKWLLSDLKPKIRIIESLDDRLIKMVEMLNEYYKTNKPYIKNFPVNITNEYDCLAEKILPPKKEYFGIAVGAGDQRKIWPLENFIKIANHYKLKFIPVFFLGPNENYLKEKIQKKVSNAIFPKTFSSGNYEDSGPLLVIALAKKLKFCISNDSGVGHMFAMAKIPQVSLFSTSNYNKYCPLNPNLIILDSKKWGSNRPEAIPVIEVIKALDVFTQKI